MGPSGASSASTSRQPSGGSSSHHKRRTTPQFRVQQQTAASSDFYPHDSSMNVSNYSTDSSSSPSQSVQQSAFGSNRYNSASSSAAIPTADLGNNRWGGGHTLGPNLDPGHSNPAFPGARSYGSVGSYNASSAGSSGFAFALGAPANTPQQTPSERGGQHFFSNNPSAGLEASYSDRFGNGTQSTLGSVSEVVSSPGSSGGYHSSGEAGMMRSGSNSPRRLVSGFEPIDQPAAYHH